MGVRVNNISYSGRNITIKNGKVIVDGYDVTPDEKEINILVDGNIEELKVDACEKVTVTGQVGNIKTMSGSIEVLGSVNGNVKTMSGSVQCDDIGGSVETMSGSIRHRKI